MTLNLNEFDVLVFDIEGTVCPISFVKDVLVSRPVFLLVSLRNRSDFTPLTHVPRPSVPLTASGPGPPHGSHQISSQPPLPDVLRPAAGLCTQIPGARAAEPSSAKLRNPFALFTDFTHFAMACTMSTTLQPADQVLDQEWDSPEFAKYRDAFPEEYRNSRSDFEAHVRDLVKRDVKIAYLKSLQGYLWLQGYKSGNIVAPLFPDVEPFFNEATQAGKKIIIYSSGSVPAQKLLFSHTNSAKSDMTPLIADYFDTTNAGPKTEVDSYAKIISEHPEHKDVNRWLFLSDNINEVKAAVGAGMRSLPVVRPGNAPLPPDEPLSKLAITEFKHSEVASLGV
ncbi:enolase-phosphatase e1 [Fusarium pseudocircinatum]|uniref:Enolase-phosphatase e1 n=1 Tax=Fusarium pseudocircinatum TaxID=56676 RepID=A0A8H5LFJ6_9HYPO|nr:enolase-phosphatase e1 [Fusarium pseudocircinatum]